jgi:threonine synthase
MDYVCVRCGRRLGEDLAVWRCPCGGLLELAPPGPFAREQVVAGEPGLWRYAAALPAVAAADRLRLGEVLTPLVPADLGGLPVLLKLDHLLPTGSYKDRGAAVLMSRLRTLGVTEVVEDSSGNAGAAIAAYSAAAGIDCTILTPATNSPAKLAQIRAYGAHLVPVPGDRAAVAAAALERAEATFYASHNRQPLFLAGVATVGFEIWEQLGHRAPGSVIVPAGHGSLVLGLARAFEALRAAGAIETLPEIHAVQSEAFPALASALRSGAMDIEATGGEAPTLAEGIACREPIRGRAVLAALRASGGGAFTVTETEIRDALLGLARSGFYVEPTGAVAAAGLRRLASGGGVPPGPTVVVLTGSGLKAGARIAELMAAPS